MKHVNFEEKVYYYVKQIPKGKVSTYKLIAEKIGSKSWRAIGNALNKNKNKKVPCHRVVKSNLEVGDFARGKREKIRLLSGEGIKIKNGKIQDTKFLFKF